MWHDFSSQTLYSSQASPTSSLSSTFSSQSNSFIQNTQPLSTLDDAIPFNNTNNNKDVKTLNLSNLRISQNVSSNDQNNSLCSQQNYSSNPFMSNSIKNDKFVQNVSFYSQSNYSSNPIKNDKFVRNDSFCSQPNHSLNSLKSDKFVRNDSFFSQQNSSNPFVSNSSNPFVSNSLKNEKFVRDLSFSNNQISSQTIQPTQTACNSIKSLKQIELIKQSVQANSEKALNESLIANIK
jgi:hypothetical protein